MSVCLLGTLFFQSFSFCKWSEVTICHTSIIKQYKVSVFRSVRTVSDSGLLQINNIIQWSYRLVTLTSPSVVTNKSLSSPPVLSVTLISWSDITLSSSFTNIVCPSSLVNVIGGFRSSKHSNKNKWWIQSTHSNYGYKAYQATSF